MRIRNGKCIRRLSSRSLRAAGKKNLVSVCAIMLTTLLFTALFTVASSVVKSYEIYNFKQVGGYGHGAVKEVDARMVQRLSAQPLVKAFGERTVIGLLSDGVFAKKTAELSWMDVNCAKWSWCVPIKGHLPEAVNELYMDEEALRKLGVKAEPGQEVTLSFQIYNGTEAGPIWTDTFVLSGVGGYDELLPVHYINVSEEYVRRLEDVMTAQGFGPFRTDLTIMLYSDWNIEGQLTRIVNGAGYRTDNPSAENYVRLGVNWGYASESLLSSLDFGTFFAMILLIVLMILTGYLIIHNIFRMAVAEDIRFYGLLKTVGVTPYQLRKIIRERALFLSAAGIPAGLLPGYLLGAVLLPAIFRTLSLQTEEAHASASVWIFVSACGFSLLTVFLSCAKPGRIAGSVAPVEAVRYTESEVSGKRRRGFGKGLFRMAVAGLSRSPSKTALAVLSMSLSVILLNVLVVFVGGFDAEKYLAQFSCADFVVSSPEHFNGGGHNASIDEDTVRYLNEHTQEALGGSGYQSDNMGILCYAEKERVYQMSDTHRAEADLYDDDNGMKRIRLQLEGLDKELFSKLTVVEGSLEEMLAGDEDAIAICVYTDDFGGIDRPEIYPQVGEDFSVEYVKKEWFTDRRTGLLADDTVPVEYFDYHFESANTKTYKVCALVTIPNRMRPPYTLMYGYRAVLPAEVLKKDSHTTIHRMFYLFDTPDEESEQQAEELLKVFTGDAASACMYESKATLRAHFDSFRRMFLLTGGVLCFLVGLVGLLNFFHVILAGIYARKKEFAVLSAVGLTKRQLRRLLIYEGVCYAVLASGASILIALFMTPMSGKVMSRMFWFYTYRFHIAPVFAVSAIFLLLGILIPTALYSGAAKSSVAERLMLH